MQSVLAELGGVIALLALTFGAQAAEPLTPENFGYCPGMQQNTPWEQAGEAGTQPL